MFREVYEPQYADEIGTLRDGYDSEEIDGKTLSAAMKLYKKYQIDELV